MKKLFFAWAFFCSSLFAAPVQLSFTKAPVQSFLAAVYGDVLKRPYVLSPDLVTLSRTVTLNVAIEPEKLQTFISGFLADQGITASDRDGVTYLATRTSQIALQGPDLSSPLPLPLSRENLPQTKQDLQPTIDTASLSFKLFTPSKVTPGQICDSVNKVFPNSCTVSVSAALLVHPRHLELIYSLAESLDKRSSLVDVSVTFVEVTGSTRDGFGLNLVANVLKGALGLNLGAASDTSAVTFKSTSLTALLDVLRTDGRFKQVANPSGRVVTGQAFNIAIGDEVPTLSGQSRDATGQVTSQVVYRPSGVLLNVSPQVVSDGSSSLVYASVDAQVSSFSKTETGVNGTPTLSRRQVKTTLSLEDGEVAAIGGLSASRDTNSSSSLFGVQLGHREDAQSTDLVLLLSAKVAK